MESSLRWFGNVSVQPLGGTNVIRPNVNFLPLVSHFLLCLRRATMRWEPWDRVVILRSETIAATALAEV